MDRVPCRVSADLRRHQREHPGSFPPNEKRIQKAREEIVEAILKGQGWRGHVVSAVLEDYLNVTPPELYDRLGEIGARLKLLANYEDATLPLLRDSTKTWLRDLIEKYIRPEWIEDRAAELAREG